jgi:ATP-binding cassette, subfamily B, bacterial
VPEAPWSGFAPDEALRRLLRRRGLEGDVDSAGRVPGPEGMVAALEGCGLQARLATLGPGELAFLEGPTLAELDDGSWMLLEEAGKGAWHASTPGGRVRMARDEAAARCSGLVLDLAPGLPPGATLWERLKPLFLGRPHALLQVGLAALLTQALALATPAVTALVVNRALPDGARHTLGLVLAGMLLATLHQAWIGWVQGRVVLHLLTRVDLSLVRGFLDHLLRCPFPFLQARTLGDLLQAFEGLAAARELLPAKAVGTFLNGVLGLLYLVVMLVMLPALALSVVAATLLLCAGTALAGRAMVRLQARQVEAEAREQGFHAEVVGGMATLKALGAEDRALAHWRRLRWKVLVPALARERAAMASQAGMGLVGQGLSVALLAQGGVRMLGGSLEAGTFFAFLQISAGFTGSLLGVVQTLLALVMLRPRFRKAEEILAVEPQAPPAEEGDPPGAVEVELEDVWFRYGPGQPWVLEGRNLRLERGEKRRLEGPSGSGKSTLLRLLAGLLEPERGRIRVGGRAPVDARGRIAYLPQSARIFGGSILDNLRVHAQGAGREPILDAARRTGLEAWAATLPMGLRTLLPPGGGSLSGGQRQLIALTGALASGRPLLLLDEALANLDAARASRLQTLLAEGPWTVVAASHTAVRSFRT